MTVQTRTIDYDLDGATFEGLLAFDDADGARPGVMVVHAWGGRSEFEDNKAKALAELGYAAFSVDLYGKGVRGSTTEENQGLIAPFIGDRPMLQKRLAGNLDVMRAQAEVSGGAAGAIGFCFGSLCVLDMARSGANVAGVVSFHGLLGTPGNTIDKIDAKVLALHGYDDPMATPENLVEFGAEMTKAKADWQAHAYGGVMHAFTNPDANDPGFGTVYDANADKRSWRAMQNFLNECLG